MYIDEQGFIQGGGGGGGFNPPLRISGGDIPPLFFVNTKVKSKLKHEICHHGIINSWLCYSLLGEALGGFSNP